MSPREPVVAPLEPTPPESLPRRRPTWLPAVLVVLAGAIVFLPALRSPLFLDDYFQTSMVEGTYPSPRSPFDLYDFVGDADRAVLMDRGLLPWWSHPRITVRFLRPLSSALIYADHRILGNVPLLSHLHSFAWWAAAVLGAMALYKKTLTRRAALFAAFIFALGSCHAFPLVWLANREVLVSGTFGILAVGALVRLRERGGVLHALAATLFFGVALLGGEYALGFGGYALALAATGRRTTPGRRVASLASYAVPALAYLVVRSKLGYGAEGSGFYHDPFRDPAAFLIRVPRRLMTLLVEGWMTIEPESVAGWAPTWALAILTVAGVALIIVPLKRTLASLDDERRENAVWLLFGSIAALVPMLAVMPAPRVLLASFLGIAAIVGLILERAWFPPVVEPRAGASELTGLVALGLGFAHLVHGPGSSWLTTRDLRTEALKFVEHAHTLADKVPDPTKAEVVVVRGLSGSVFVLPYALDAKGTPPARYRILSLASHVLVHRSGPRTLEIIAPRDKSVFPTDEGNLFRGEGRPFAVGDVVDVPGMRVTVVDVGEAGPRRVRFEFDEPFESPERVWVTDRADGLFDATPPAVGYGAPYDQWPPTDDAKKESE
jgi:hypothetical protein